MGIFGMIMMMMRPQRTLTPNLMRVTMRSALLCTLFPGLWQCWQNCRKIYSRKPENPEGEMMFIQTPDFLDINGNIGGYPCDYKPGENDSLSPSNSCAWSQVSYKNSGWIRGALSKKQLNSIQSKCLIGKSIMAINQARLKTSKWNLLNVYIIAHAFGFQ